MALTAAHRVPLDARDLDEPADRGRTSSRGGAPSRSRRPGTPARGVPPSASQSAAAAIALETPTSAWHPPIAAEIVAPLLEERPDLAGDEEEVDDLALRHLPLGKAEVVEEDGRG